MMEGNSDGIDATPSNFPGYSDRPVERVKYGDAQKFVEQLMTR